MELGQSELIEEDKVTAQYELATNDVTSYTGITYPCTCVCNELC
jgi:hypothetical protein